MKNNFFLKRKKSGSENIKKENKKVKLAQEEISSDEDFSEQDTNHVEESSDEETAQEKKLRIAKQYISQIEQDCETKEAVCQRLKEEVLEEAGRLCKKRAHEYTNIVPETDAIIRKHKLSITCLAVSPCEKYIFSGSKDSCIIKWDLSKKKKVKMINYGKCEEGPGHTYPVTALALSSNGKFLASGCEGNLIKIWNSETLDLLKTFRGHKGPITGLVFQKGTNNLISSSKDRSLKVWNIDEMGYVETLFGHQDGVAGIDCHGECVITCGTRDGTVRMWKIAEETQLVYNGDGGSIDCIAASGFQSFVSGGEDGTLHLWTNNKKKPRSQVEKAHGLDESEVPNWIVCVATLKNSDVIATGSKDGFIRLWKRDDESHSIVPISQIPVTGFVNCLEFSPSGEYLIAGIGQEHRCGRWFRIKEAKNSIVVYKF